MPDLLPQSDAEILNWTDNFLAHGTAILAALGLVTRDLTPVTAARTACITTSANLEAQATPRAARQKKYSNLAKLHAEVRALVWRRQRIGAADNSAADALGLTE